MKPEVRERFVLPILIPVGLLAVIAAVAVGFGMLMFYNPMTVSLTVAIVVAAGILGAFGLISSERAGELTGARRGVVALAGVVPILMLALVATGVIPTTDQRVSEREPHAALGVTDGTATVGATEYDFEPGQFQFNSTGELEFTMTNEGSIQHTFVIEGREGDLKLSTASGATDSGTIQLDGGSYTFYCDVPGHRAQGMEGQFQVAGGS